MFLCDRMVGLDVQVHKEQQEQQQQEQEQRGHMQDQKNQQMKVRPCGLTTTFVVWSLSSCSVWTVASAPAFGTPLGLEIER